jgi:hypothetical protein
MPKFALLLHESPFAYQDLSPEHIQAIIQKYIACMNGLKAQGRYISGEKLCPERLVVRRENDELATDGPYMESKEVVGGLMIVEADSYQHAAELSRGSPHFDRGWIEIRRVDLA